MVESCSSDECEHDGRCCKQCPKGSHVVSHCSSSSNTACAKCTNGTFTGQNNYLYKCLSCKICDSDSHQRVLTPCKADSDTKCECVQGYYSSHSTVLHCVKVKQCSLGQGVSVPPNSYNNTKCIDCPAGTFSNVTDYQSPCWKHTRCEEPCRSLISSGTNRSDAVCGDFITQCCHWTIPAGLWAGLILTLFIAVGLGYLKFKHRRRRRRTVIVSVASEFETPAVLPPDVIKHPKSPELLTSAYKADPHARVDAGCWQTDGIEMQTLWGKYGNLSVPETCPSLSTDPSMFKSEPEEDEWPGV